MEAYTGLIFIINKSMTTILSKHSMKSQTHSRTFSLSLSDSHSSCFTSLSPLSLIVLTSYLIYHFLSMFLCKGVCVALRVSSFLAAVMLKI